MKLFLLITLSLLSLNVFAGSEVGQNPTTPCEFSDQAGRDKKLSIAPVAEPSQEKEETAVTGK